MRNGIRFLQIRTWRHALWFACLVQLTLAPPPARAVIFDDENRLTVVLKDGSQVNLIGEATSTPGTKSRAYYYLPVNLRLSRRPDNTPEFLFLKFTTEARATQGGINGAVLHFLTEWGLTPQQEEEVRAKLKKDQNNAELKGAVTMMPDGDSGTFQIVSGTLTDKGLASSVVTSGKAPLMPGGKAAAAARLSAEGAQLLDATLEKTRSIADVSLALNYAYETLAPAAKGTITFDWTKVEREYNSLEAEYKKTQTGTSKTSFLGITLWSSPTYSYSYDEMRRQYRFMEEKGIVKLQFDELVKDERVTKIREAFFQYFLNAMAQPAAPENGAPPAPSNAEKEKSPDIRYGNSYRFKQTSIKNAFSRKTQVFSLNYRMSLRWPYQLVGNMASWYDGARNNPKCVASVNLNDPFFQHRDINFILDLDAKEIFEDVINYVTINVRKNRSAGRPFEDRATIDAKHLKEKGITTSFTYARGEDRNADVYEYQAQWSLKGGYIYPPDAPWVKGSWEGVTLTPPVVPRNLEVEADLEAMKASQVTRVTVQIHYPKFGNEVEENIHISPAQGQALVARRIFIDRGAKGYAYRLIVNHATEGKLVLPWSARVGDDYIYAAIPKDLLSTDSPVLVAAKEAAKTVTTAGTEKVLDKFNELFGGK